MNSPGSQSNSHELKIFYGYGVTGSFIIKSLSHLDVFAVLVTGLVIVLVTYIVMLLCKGPYFNYVSMFLSIFDQLSTLVKGQ